MKALIARLSFITMISVVGAVVAGCTSKSVHSAPLVQVSPSLTVTASATTSLNTDVSTVIPETALEIEASATPVPVTVPENVYFTLETAAAKGKLLFVGVGGEIDGLVNPDLEVKGGATVQIELINGDGMQHDVSFPDFGVTSSPVFHKGDSTVISFVVGNDQSGVFAYFCTVPGHRQAGQEGRLIVSQSLHDPA